MRGLDRRIRYCETEKFVINSGKVLEVKKKEKVLTDGFIITSLSLLYKHDVGNVFKWQLKIAQYVSGSDSNTKK